GYGFNKSHSAAYALVSYQTMWLKAHYPAAFMAAVLSADMDSTDKVVTLIDECRNMKLEVTPPHINHSEHVFTVSGDSTVVYGLGAIKGVGESAIESIIQARQADGPYSDLFEFCRRIDLRKANRRVLESLIRAGALDQLGSNRRTLMEQLPVALKMAEQHHATQAAGQNDLFGMGGGEETAIEPDLQGVPTNLDEWDDELRLEGEKKTLGLYLTGHPIDRYLPEMAGLGVTNISKLSLDSAGGGNGGQFRKRGGQRVMVAGLAMSVSHRPTPRGRMGSVLLDDKSGRIEATLFSEVYEEYHEQLVTDRILVLVGNLSYDEYRGGLSLRAEQVYEFEQARNLQASHLKLTVDWHTLLETGAVPKNFVRELAQLLAAYQGGGCSLRVGYTGETARGVMELSDEWRIKPTDELLKRLNKFLGAGNVEVVYGVRRNQREQESSVGAFS
ncbi:MAG: OB-fold nucleic acid binding domain-containing protein, partial [Chromatiales bacterium]|nr:OB-fold nucleic acid binding domain-containing protein [Chromatiales bacterium]